MIQERGPWEAGCDEASGPVFIESADFTHDVRLYVNGDFSTWDEKFQYAVEIARRLNAGSAASVCEKREKGDG